MAQKIALTQIEYDGTTYNWGDEVPDEVVEAHPTATGDKPLSESDIASMNKTELAEALRKLTGNSQEGEADEG